LEEVSWDPGIVALLSVPLRNCSVMLQSCLGFHSLRVGPTRGGVHCFHLYLTCLLPAPALPPLPCCSLSQQQRLLHGPTCSSCLSSPSPPAARAIFCNINQTASVPRLKPFFSDSPGALRTKTRLYTTACKAWPGPALLTLHSASWLRTGPWPDWSLHLPAQTPEGAGRN
jgi:hypothetical protein